MPAELPETIDPRQFTGRGRRIRGMMPGAALARLSALVDRFDGEVRVDLAFGRDEHARMRITGAVQSAVMMTCQRCLKPMRVRLDCRVALGVVFDERQADGLPPDLEPLLLDDTPALLGDIVEDELLLALPAVAGKGGGGGGGGAAGTDGRRRGAKAEPLCGVAKVEIVNLIRGRRRPGAYLTEN